MGDSASREDGQESEGVEGVSNSLPGIPEEDVESAPCRSGVTTPSGAITDGTFLRLLHFLRKGTKMGDSLPSCSGESLPRLSFTDGALSEFDLVALDKLVLRWISPPEWNKDSFRLV